MAADWHRLSQVGVLGVGGGRVQPGGHGCLGDGGRVGLVDERGVGGVGGGRERWRVGEGRRGRWRGEASGGAVADFVVGAVDGGLGEEVGGEEGAGALRGGGGVGDGGLRGDGAG